MLMNFRGGPHFEGSMLMNSKGEPHHLEKRSATRDNFYGPGGMFSIIKAECFGGELKKAQVTLVLANGGILHTPNW